MPINDPEATRGRAGGRPADQFSDAYERRYPALRRADERLQSILKSLAAAIEDKTLVRAEVRPSRIKGVAELERKARKNQWGPDDALSRCGDLVGGRVVCNNVEDVYRFAELLKENLPAYSDWFEIQDQIKQPDKDGYRALHVNFRLNISETLGPDLVPCEVQIRTRLQDAWAELSHPDIYKRPGINDDLRARAKDLAAILATADNIATDIRLQAARQTDPPATRPNLGTVSAAALQFIFKETFGRKLPDYAAAQYLNLCETLGITSLDRLPEAVSRSEFRDNVGDAYRAIVGISPGNEDVFLAVIYSVTRGDKQALKYIRQKAGRERRETDQIARRELLSSLPDSVEALIEQLENARDEVDIVSIADAIGATSECAICATTVVDAETFADSIVQHYGVPDDEEADVRDRIEQAVRNSGVEMGGCNTSSLCGYHADQAAKDD